MAIFQPQIVGKGGETYIAGKGINIDEESKEISVVDPVLVNESTIEGVVQIGDYELLDSNGTIPEDRLASTASATAGQVLTLDANKNAVWTNSSGGQEIQFDDLPEATSENVGQILQYVGETIPDVDATAIATQTVGSGLSDLSVDVKKFEDAEQPTQSENTSFVADVNVENAALGTRVGTFVCNLNSAEFLARLVATWGNEWWNMVRTKNPYFVYTNSGWALSSQDGPTTISDPNASVKSYGVANTDWGFYVIDDSMVQVGDYVSVIYTEAGISWSKNGTIVDLANYGISYSGTPADGDTVSVAYTPGEKGITQGYFYANQPKYSDASATISQTVGSGLTGLSVNVDTFAETEQPTQSETVDFVSTGLGVEITSGQSQGVSVEIVNQSTFINKLIEEADSRGLYPVDEFSIGARNPYATMTTGIWKCDIWIQKRSSGAMIIEDQDPSLWGLQFSGESTAADTVYVIEYDHLYEVWTKNGSVVTLSDYGISYSGTPADGDTLTVSYSAPAPIGYSWNQINVQPSSSSGGGIEWKTTLDLPKNYSGSQWNTSAIVTIPGGLPDGDYEFYYKTLCYSETDQEAKRYATLKVQFTFDSANNSCRGCFAPVIDGNWMPSGNYKINNMNAWSPFGSHGSDFVFYCADRPFATDIPAYNDVSGGVKDCFSVSSFKNIQTGQEYVPVLALYDGTDSPIDSSYDGHISMQSFQSDPYIPQYHTTNQWEYDDNSQYARIQPYASISRDNMPASCSELDVALVSSNGGKWHCIVENGYNSYVARVLEASGDLANAQIGFNSNGETFLFFNTASGTSGSIYASIGAKGSSEAASGWIETPGSFTSVTLTKIGMPVTADNFGMIEQYLGVTDSTYTNGYFYKATGDEVVVPSTTVCNQTYGAETIDITCLDFDGFVAALSRYIGWSKDYVKELLANRHFMSYRPTEDSKWYFYGYGAIPDSVGISNYFTLSPEPSAETQFTVTHTEGHTEIQNPHWEQVNVQPGSSPSYPSTMPVLLQDNWGEDQETGELVQTIENIAEVHANSVVIVAPAPLSTEDYANNEVLCIGQGEGSLTFKCATVPSNDITVNVICL